MAARPSRPGASPGMQRAPAGRKVMLFEICERPEAGGDGDEDRSPLEPGPQLDPDPLDQASARAISTAFVAGSFGDRDPQARETVASQRDLLFWTTDIYGLTAYVTRWTTAGGGRTDPGIELPSRREVLALRDFRGSSRFQSPRAPGGKGYGTQTRATRRSTSRRSDSVLPTSAAGSPPILAAAERAAEAAENRSEARSLGSARACGVRRGGTESASSPPRRSGPGATRTTTPPTSGLLLTPIASQHRREAEEEGRRAVAEAEEQARAMRETAEDMARKSTASARRRVEELRQEIRLLEDRRERAVQSLRDVAAQLEDVLLRPRAGARPDQVESLALDDRA